MKRALSFAVCLETLTRFLSLAVPSSGREFLVGDLLEGARVRREKEGRFSAALWWSGQVFNVFLTAPGWHCTVWREQPGRVEETDGAEKTNRTEQTVQPGLPSSTSRAGMSLAEKHMHGAWSDLRFVVRQLSKSPGFVLTSVLILGLGLGANLTIFSLANAVLLRPANGLSEVPEHFSVLSRTEQDKDFDSSLSYPDFVDLRTAFEGQAELAARDDMPVGLRLGTVTERRRGAVVSGNYFSVLGVGVVLGRALEPADDQALLASPVAVISYRLWRDRLGSRREALGQQVSLNGMEFEIVGVAARGFRGDGHFQTVDIWVPMAMQPVARPAGSDVLNERESTWMGVVGRRQPGVPLHQLRPLAHSMERSFSAYNEGETRRREFALAEGLGLDPADRRAAGTLMVALLFVASLVLMIACANVTNLILARSNRRVSEVSLRRALGAGQGHIVRLLLTESLVVAFMAAIAGLGMAMTFRGVLMGALPSIARDSGLELTIDGRVVGFAVVLALLSAAFFGLAPAVSSSALKPSRSMGTSPSLRSKGRLRSGLVVAQLALSVVLLMNAGLLLQTMQKLQAVPPGFQTHGVLSAAIDLGITSKSPREMGAFYLGLLDQLDERPEVASAALASTMPLTGSSDTYGGLQIEGNNPPPGRLGWSAQVNLVTGGFFETLSIPLATGRDFDRTDTFSSPPVVIVNRAFQKRYWPNQDVLGKTISLPSRGDRVILRVVGMANDVHYGSLRRPPAPMMYLPLQQRGEARVAIAIRASNDREASAVTESLESIVASLDNDVPVFARAPLAALVDDSLSQTKLIGKLISLFGVLALILASVGLYGLVACLVSERKKEIGIRLALGAGATAVVNGFFQRSLRLSAWAVGIGLLGSLMSGRLLAGFFYGTKTLNPALMLGVAILLLIVAATASLGPLVVATRLQPAKVLRAD